MGDTTDDLLDLAEQVTPTPPARELDMLLTSGERISMALLAMAIAQLGAEARSFTGSQAGVITDEAHGAARIIDVTPGRIQSALDAGHVAIVAGFQGVSQTTKDITTLGRGGSDTTAVALAAALGADVCEIYTDVDGVFTADPRILPSARKIDVISLEEMLDLAASGSKILHLRCVEYARRYGIPIHVRSSWSQRPGTMVVANPYEGEGAVEAPIIAGIAAGLGLAALASHLGLGEEMGTVLLLLLLVVGAVFVFRLLAARRGSSGPQPAYQGSYSPSQLGREAAVRYSADDSAAQSGVPTGPGTRAAGAFASVGDAQAGRIPAGFDVEGFERNAKVQFVRLQAVFDAGDTKDLREFTTPEMYAELALQIDERSGAENRTDVVTLDATLLGIESTAQEHVASVRFSGMIREEVGGEAKPFDEVWNLAKPASGPGGWLLAGIQQLD
jgi:predicted lipid-binding transport protein (Tim44 family)